MKTTKLWIVTIALSLSACGGGNTDSSGSGGSGGGTQKIDACAIVTQQDATGLFGNTASQQQDNQNVDANLIGSCLWGWDSATDSQLLQFRIWNGEQYYQAPSDSTAYAIGDKGYVRSKSGPGVEVGWVQSKRSIFLSYQTIGTNVPDATTKVKDIEALATKCSGALK